MTKTIKKLTALLFSATILILLGGCSSTEIIDSPQEPAKKGRQSPSPCQLLKTPQPAPAPTISYAMSPNSSKAPLMKTSK